MFDTMIAEYGSEAILEKLTPLISEERKARIAQVLSDRLKTLEVGVEAPSCVYNALAIVRSAEAFGIDQFHLIESEIKRRQGKSTTSGSNKWVQTHQHAELDTFFAEAKKRGIQVIGAELEGSVGVEEIEITGPICLLFGNEKRGLSKQAKAKCHQRFRINMFGMVESLNIAAAASIALWSLQKKIRDQEGAPCHLSEKEIQEKKALFYLKTVGVKVAQSVLARYS